MDRHQGETWISVKVPDVNSMRAETTKAQPVPRGELDIDWMSNGHVSEDRWDSRHMLWAEASFSCLYPPKHASQE